ncbi:Tricarboxylate transport protein [Lasiodiplodia hormozganensis]|uniref:Tricarboxylate transport protein n=1 Tax=Lasiodiplodia hormozganensis TaxID=869390 RepID=A0AA40CQI1_9PEZI|nr:Tricarboxylate transport protein [Lasiodiplodia hormozganensis]
MAHIAPTTQTRTGATTDSRPKPTISPLASLISGSVAGGIEATLTYPFEYAKTCLQLRSATPTGPSSTTNPFHVLLHTARTEGIPAIYAGCSTLVLGTALKAGVRFTTFDSVKNTLAEPDGRLSPARSIFAGSVAGAVESVVAVTPTERIKTALIDDAKGARRFRSAPHAVAVLVREQGLRTMYRGLVSTTAKQSANSAVRMGSYNAMKEAYRARFGCLPKSTPETFALGAIAGTVTVYATQPFDTVKTRAQSARGERLGQAVRGVWRDGGVRGFWKGSTMRLARLVFAGGIVFSVYEVVAEAIKDVV